MSKKKIALCYLDVNGLTLMNGIKFKSTTQRQLYDRFVNKNFTIDEDYISKISDALPDGVEVKEITITSIDAKALYTSYTEKVEELDRLSNAQKELLMKDL